MKEFIVTMWYKLDHYKEIVVKVVSENDDDIHLLNEAKLAYHRNKVTSISEVHHDGDGEFSDFSIREV